VIALDASGGKELWRSVRRSAYARPTWSAPTLVATDEVVLVADRTAGLQRRDRGNKAGSSAVGVLTALSADTGRQLWSVPAAEGCGTDDQEPVEMLKESLEIFEGKRGGVMWAVDKADGRRLAEYRLESPPVFDGLIAANGRLYISSKNGTLACWSQRRRRVSGRAQGSR